VRGTGKRLAFDATQIVPDLPNRVKFRAMNVSGPGSTLRGFASPIAFHTATQQCSELLAGNPPIEQEFDWRLRKLRPQEVAFFVDTLELISASVRLETLSDLVRAAQDDGHSETVQWLLGQIRQHEGNLRMLVAHAEARIGELDERDPAEAEEKRALRSGVERAWNILALVQTRHPQSQNVQSTARSRGGRGR
jgi:hypothetical protein